MEKESIEGRAAATLLQRTDEIQVAGCTFEVCQPTPATLIMVSGLVGEMPHINTNPENVVYEVLRSAKDCLILGKIAAVLVLGAKRVKQRRRKKSGLFGLKTALEVDWLADALLHEYTTKQLAELITGRLGEMQIGDFFGITASLFAVNLLKSTKEAETFGE